MTEEKLIFNGITFIANSLRSIYEPNTRTLLIADCHFGKAAHFRNNNIPVPQSAALADYQNLNLLLINYKPAHCIILGDLFHSVANFEWQWLNILLKENSGVNFTLIQGNHDVLPAINYINSGIQVLDSLFFLNNTLLTHEPVANKKIPNVCGHIHPGFSIKSKARQRITLPCFYITNFQLIMPSFGQLTGCVNMNTGNPEARALLFTKEEFYWSNQV